MMTSKFRGKSFAPITIMRLPAAELKSLVDERLKELPDFTQSVYQKLRTLMYAEPGFSDVTVPQLAEEMGCTVFAINSSIGWLIHYGLVFTVQDSGSNVSDLFIHTYEHDYKAEDC